MIVIVLVLVVVLPAFNGHGDPVSMAQSYYGGSWKEDLQASGTAVELNSGFYSVTFANGTKTTMTYSQLTQYFASTLNEYRSYISSFGSGSGYFVPTFSSFSYDAHPQKVYFTILNGTVDGQNTSIVMVGVYYNSTPNSISGDYNQLKEQISSCTRPLPVSTSTDGVSLAFGQNGNSYYFFFSLSNLANAGVQDVDYSSVGVYASFSQNQGIAVIFLGVSPSLSQAQGFSNVVQSNI
ncbi:hypothetical protein [Sulfuracidifex tepidarius]|uniref:hypothetical protein n=1 Tax=Sulfuracidifex tepidarius TaxID=1294262 RepID=UPI0006CFA642|nr:hypothetical protein [Sulfuracidifex tepidarius]